MASSTADGRRTPSKLGKLLHPDDLARVLPVSPDVLGVTAHSGYLR